MNKEFSNSSLDNEDIEGKLWSYIDGEGSGEERSVIEKLIEANREWKEKYHELLELHQLVHSSTMEEPSMRFTKNVMEEIAKYHIAPATKNYINKKLVTGIGLFFVLTLVITIIYSFGLVNWNSGDNSLPFKTPTVNYGKIFNNTYITVFMMINVVLGLMLLDRYLSSKRKSLQKQA